MNERHHLSDLDTFARCEQLWEFTSHHRLNLQPNILPYPLFLGIAAHYYYEYFRNDPIKAVLRYEQTQPGSVEAYGSQIEKLEKIFGTYRLLDPVTPFPSKCFEVVGTEYIVDFEIYGIPFQTRFDRVLQDWTGQYFIEDLKTTSNIGSMQSKLMFHDLQRYMLQFAFRQKWPNRDFGGTIYTLLQSKPAETPKWLTSGLFSTDQSLHSNDLDFIRHAMEYHQVGRDEIKFIYKDFIKQLQHNRSEFLYRMLLPPVARANEEMMLRTIASKANRIEAVTKFRDMLPTGLHLYGQCANCPFFNPCLQRRQGNNPDLSSYPTREGYIR